MPSEQLPILFEDENPKNTQKKVSKSIMQSEEEWSPRSIAAEEKPTAKKAATEKTAAKPKVTRTRKPRATSSKKGAAAEKAAESSSDVAEKEPAEEKPTATRTRRAAAKKPAAEEPASSDSKPESDVGRESEPPQVKEEEPNRPVAKESKEASEGNEPNRRRDRHDSRRGGHNQQRQGGGGGSQNRKKRKRKGRAQGGDRPQGGASQQSVAERLADLPNPSEFQNVEELAREAVEQTSGEILYYDELFTVSLHELVERAEAMGVVLESAPNRQLLIGEMLEKAAEEERPVVDRGVLEVTANGHGFVTRHAHNYRVEPEDTYVAASIIRHYGMKKGHIVEVQVRAPENQERCPAAIRVIQVMGRDPKEISDIVPFEDLVPYYPLERLLLEVPNPEKPKDVSMRAVDLLTPIGFGQRGLIVAPPRTGKTVILQQIANSIATNSPHAHLIVLLIDERPEEVTDFRRHTKGEVVSSTFDEPASNHVEVAEMVIEKARRMVEVGEHVVILLDSITRLARAYNTMMPSSGKILSGGVESNALQKPKRFFGAARNIEGGGSLTILATALIDTGSRMDEVIFEEFKGTGNMELHLDRALVDKRIFPALNIEKSGTRKEELLYHPEELDRIYSLRRALQGVPMVEAMEMLVERLRKTRSNAECLLAMNR